MSAVNSDQRRLLENVVGKARDAAEVAASAALKRLAVDQDDYFATMTPDERSLRNLLRAEARRLGDKLEKDPDKPFPALCTEVAYQHWHRMLFARFLAENNLLMFEGSDTPVTLDECAEIAEERGESDAWAVASRYAAAMLPGVFRLGDPALQVRFASEGRQELERLLNSLPASVFHADDSLGWVYQFWQAKAKAEVNASGRKIGGADISVVTQLFTDHYMVQFLLHNSLGAWWATRHSDESRPTDTNYLRRLDDGTPAAGTFPDWPARAKELRILDPCCGSGHFLVAAFALMVRFRMVEEGLSAREAGDAVLRDNLFGLELDPRCTQIAAFALALAAWKNGGYRELPLPNVACSGTRLGGDIKDWARLAEKDGKLRAVLVQLRELFANAPDLGSLIDPATVGLQSRRPTVSSSSVATTPGQGALMNVEEGERQYAGEPLVEAEQVLTKLSEAAARFGADADDTPIFGEAAKQAVRAVRLLSKKYHLVITNVPYLARGKHDETLRKFCAAHYDDAKADLATVFVRRCLQFCVTGGSTALVTPQNWLFLGSYTHLRGYLLRQKAWNVVARLGPGAFETISGEVVNVGLFVLTNAGPKTGFVPEKEVDPFAAHAEVCRRLEELFDKISVPRRETQFGPRTGTLDEERYRLFDSEFEALAERNPGERAAMERARAEYRELLAKSEAHRATVFAGLNVSTPRTATEKDALLRTVSLQLVEQSSQLNNPDSRIALEQATTGKLLEEYADSLQGVSTADNPRFARVFWELPNVDGGWTFLQDTNNSSGHYSGREQIVHLQSLEESGAGIGAAIRGRVAWGKRAVAVNRAKGFAISFYTGNVFDIDIAVVLPHDQGHFLAIWSFLASIQFREAVGRLDPKMNVTNATLVKVPFNLDYWQKVADEKYPDGLPAPYSDDPTQWLFEGHPARAKGQPGDSLQVAVARLLGYRWPRQTGAEIPGCHLLPDDGLDAYSDEDGIVCIPPVGGEPSAAERLAGMIAAAYADTNARNAADTHATIERLLSEAGYGGKTLDEWLRDGFFAQHLKRFHNRPFLWHIWDGRKDGFSAIVNYHNLDRAKLEKLTYTYLGDWLNRQSDDDRNGIPGANARLVEARKLQQKLVAILEGEPPYDLYIRWKSEAEQPLGWEPDLNDGVRLNIRPFVQAEVLRVKKPSINWNKDRGTNPDGGERHNDLHLTLAQKRKAREEASS